MPYKLTATGKEMRHTVIILVLGQEITDVRIPINLDKVTLLPGSIKSAFLYNSGQRSVYLGDESVTVANGRRLPARGSAVVELMPDEAIYAVCRRNESSEIVVSPDDEAELRA